jgi:hypothetical protein
MVNRDRTENNHSPLLFLFKNHPSILLLAPINYSAFGFYLSVISKLATIKLSVRGAASKSGKALHQFQLTEAKRKVGG